MTESLSLITREIPLTKGKVTIVDAGDYEFLSQWNWFSLNDYYAARTKYIGMFNGKPKRITIKMHQVLMNAPEGFEIDHINGDGLDNRRSNLRICTHQQNIWNRRAQKGSTSKYKGGFLSSVYPILEGLYKYRWWETKTSWLLPE